MTSRGVRLLLLAITLGVCGCDQAEKHVAQRHLEGKPPMVLMRDHLDLAYTENPGMAFNAERALPAPIRTPLLWGAGFAALAVLGYAWWRQRTTPRLHHIGAAIVAGGAAGNLLDRILRGHVIDFVHLHGWPVFNGADVALAVGAGLLMIAGFRKPTTPGQVPPIAPH